MATIRPLNGFIIAIILCVCHSSNSSDSYHKDVSPSALSSSSRSHTIANSNKHNGNSNSRTPGSTDGGIYFSDIPTTDEGSGDMSSEDDIDPNARGRDEDDEDTSTDGSGSDLDDNDNDEGSGDDGLFLTSEKPTLKPEIIKTPITPPSESRDPKRKDPMLDPIEENRVPSEDDIDMRPEVVVPPETSTRYTVQSSTHRPHRKESEDDYNSLNNEVSINLGRKQGTPASFFARPGILAAVIGGAVVGLLCAILLVMFIVYRMRKKDEGSYALDEPKRATAANPYARGSSKEYFA